MKDLLKICMALGIIYASLFYAPAPSYAQNEDLDIVDEPLCFRLRNTAPYKVYGSFITDYYTRPDGVRARHRSNFRLEEEGAKHEEGYPLDVAEFCTYGPFYPDRKLELVFRTLIPTFTCKTRVDQGEIIVKGHRKPEGGTVTTAKCFE